MIKKLKNKNGITLIALIITIIVMLILVAVTISMAINGGLFEKAGQAVGDTKNEINKEQGLANGRIQIDGIYYNSIDEYLSVDKTAIHDWTRTGDTFTCSHCSATYEMGEKVGYTSRAEKTSTTILAKKSGLDKYYTANSNSYPTDANVDENGNQIIEAQKTNWVVLGIEDTNKDGKYETLLITTEYPVEVARDKELCFYGAAAYNNAPSELNRICKELYSNSEFGEARSMTIEDVNSCFNNPLQAISLGGIYFDISGNAYTTGNLTTKLKDVPVFNSLKANGTYTPDGANTEEALGNYELNGYYYSLNADGTSVTSPVDPSKTSPVTEVEKNTIFGSSKNYLYWLASRGVDAGSDYASFGPGFVLEGNAISYFTLFYSKGGEYDDYAGLRPVVPLKFLLPDALIKFTIEGVTYYAEPGMTWREWLDSSFCTLEYRIADDGRVRIVNHADLLLNNNYISADDVIISGGEYIYGLS